MNDKDRLAEALGLMKNALDLLDQTGAAADIGAHLDLAINRLEEVSLNEAHLAHHARTKRDMSKR